MHAQSQGDDGAPFSRFASVNGEEGRCHSPLMFRNTASSSERFKGGGRGGSLWREGAKTDDGEERKEKETSPQDAVRGRCEGSDEEGRDEYTTYGIRRLICTHTPSRAMPSNWYCAVLTRWQHGPWWAVSQDGCWLLVSMMRLLCPFTYTRGDTVVRRIGLKFFSSLFTARIWTKTLIGRMLFFSPDTCISSPRPLSSSLAGSSRTTSFLQSLSPLPFCPFLLPPPPP